MSFQSKGMSSDRIAWLFERYMDQSITVAEERELAALALLPENNAIFHQLEQEYWNKESGEKMTEEEVGKYLTGILGPKRAIVRPVGWKRVAVAAAVVVLLGVSGYLLFVNKPERPAASVETQEQRFKNDVDPGRYKAKLMLSDGKSIVLDSAVSGELARQGNTSVIHQGNQLIYKSRGRHEGMIFNTLTTARSEMYATVLSDGTKVWLNAASGIRFPVAFSGNERRVEITGEAYFEVARDAHKLFIVSVNGMEVQVLGTHFNINAYSNEANISTTLLEGKVRVISNDKEVVLKPGQQAHVLSGIRIADYVNLENVMAWKDGRFYFENTSIEAIMRQVERWYDVEVEYKDQVPHLFVAKIPRDVTLTELLKLLELTNRVHFKIEDRKVIVMN